MSQLLYQGNNLVVDGRLGAEYFCKPDTSEEKDKRRFMYLRFIVQVNGQMRVFEEMLTLTKDTENSPIAYGEEWGLQDWDKWYTIRNMFVGLGYKFGEDQNPYSGDNQTIQKWISELLKDN